MAPKLPFDRSTLSRGVATGVRLGRGTADLVVGVAGPPLGRLTDKVITRVRRPERPSTTTFTPSPKPDEPAAEVGPETPSPASIARNIAPQRPTAKPARATKPKSAPGAKLPPPRPSTT